MSAGFDEFVTRHGPELLRLAYMLSGDRGRAEDLVQGSLVKAYRRWDSVSAADRPIAYLRTMVVREHLSWRRRRSNHEVPSTVPDIGSVSDSTTAVVETDAMWRVLAILPRRQRAVLVLRYYEDLSDASIAETLGCALGTVRSNASRGLATMRSAMSEQVGGDADV